MYCALLAPVHTVFEPDLANVLWTEGKVGHLPVVPPFLIVRSG